MTSLMTKGSAIYMPYNQNYRFISLIRADLIIENLLIPLIRCTNICCTNLVIEIIRLFRQSVELASVVLTF